ncbi:MAG: tetratricopeptide repeat protein [Planctomycetota bacterium]
MSAPAPPPPTPARPRRSPDAIERLYAYWLVSTAALLLILIGNVIVTRGALRRQAERLDTLTERLEALEHQPAILPNESPPVPPDSPPTPPASSATPDGRPEPTHPVAEAPAGHPGEPLEPSPALVPSEEALRAELDALLGEEPGPVDELADAGAAERLVELASQHMSRTNWTSVTWVRLALLARLLGRDAVADLFARQAPDGGVWRIHFAEASATLLLDRGRPADALPFIDELTRRHAPSAVTGLLRARAALAADDPAGADRALGPVTPAAGLGPADRLRLARLTLRLERWGRLAEIIATVGDTPDEWSREHAFLTAAAWARAGRCVESLALLDWLAAGPTPTTAPAVAAPQPSRYEIEVWRGVTLMLAGQSDAARQALRNAAELDPACPDALYYLGLLEARLGRTELAIMHLKNALAASARLAPAWEALAGVELDAGRIDDALDHVTQALRINPRRGSAQFLLALACAKVEQAAPAEEALRRAFQLDPQYLDVAKQTEVLTRLFPPDALERLAVDAAETPEEL